MERFLTRDFAALAMLAAAETIVWAAFFYLFPILLLRWEADLGWARGEIALALTLALGVSALASPAAGGLIDRGLARLSMPLAAAAGGLVLLLVSAVETRAGFYAGWALIGLCMSACLYDPCFAFLTRVKGAAARGPITLVTLVAGFASTLCFPIADALAAAHGWRAAAQGFAAAALLVAAPLFFAATRMLEAAPARGAPPAAGPDPRAAARAARRRPAFWLLALAFPLIGLTHGMIISHIIPILTERGAGGAAVLAASLIGPMQVAGRIAMTVSLRGWRPVSLTLACFGGVAAGVLILLGAAEAGWRIYAFVALLGASYGVISITRPLVTADLLGRDGFGAVSGSLALPYIACLAAAPYAAVLLWRAGGYDLVLGASALAAAAAAGLLAAAAR